MSTKAASDPVGDLPRCGSGQMFDRIAARYDLLNRLISFGIDQRWRRATVAALDLGPGPRRVLDVAAGTGDLTIQIAERYPEANVVGLDPSPNMLNVARRKIAAAALTSRLSCVEGTAEALPFPDASFDGVTIAFGIRNVPDRERGLAEMARVTRSGGRVCVLELSEPAAGAWGGLARFHVHTVVPWLGGLLSGDDEYRYLQRSIAAFPPPTEFRRIMEAAGLLVLQVSPLTFGTAHLYVATPARA